jgi:hypothetical protein
MLKITKVLFPAVLIIILVVFAYSNVVFFRRSLNPVLLIPPDDIGLSTGYADIIGTDSITHGWHVDLANPAYLEWPVNIFIGKSLRAGHIPLVMPNQCLGVPLIGQYCHRVLSPYQMIENLFFPLGYNYFILLRLVLAGIFTCLFLRPLCRRGVSAILAGVGYGLGTVMVVYSNHEEVSNVAMMLPLVIWAVRAFFDRPGPGRACWLTLALALVHTAGQPEIQLYVLLLAFLYGLTRIFSLPSGQRLRPFLYSAGAIILSGVIAGPQIYLFLQFHSEAWTFHPPGGNLGLQSPMERPSFLFAFLPKLRQTPWEWSYRTVNLLWDWVGGYFSMGLLFLSAAAAVRPRRNRKEIVLFSCFFLFILAKNLGWSPAQMIGVLPFFDQTWTPRWAAATWSFSLAVLAGLGLDNILDRSPETAVAATRAGETKTRRAAKLLANPLFTSGLLFADIILIIICWRQGVIHWQAEDLRGFVLFNGVLFIVLTAGLVLLWHLLPLPVRSYLHGIIRLIRHCLINRQLVMIALLSAVAVGAMRLIPLKHYFPLFGAQPANDLFLTVSGATISYLFAAPLFLTAIFGLLYIAASPARPWTVVFSAVAIPSVIISGWIKVPPAPIPVIYWGIFALAASALLVFKDKPRLLQRLLPSLSFPLLFSLVGFVLLKDVVSDPRFSWLVRYQGWSAMIVIAVFSGLRMWAIRGGTGCGWFFLFLLWTELLIYIPKNHSDQYLLTDSIPFLIATLMVLVFAAWFRRTPLSIKRRAIFLLTGIFLCGGALLFIDGSADQQLPADCTPDEPLPYIKYLRSNNRGAIVGFGRVLAPNFASAHNLLDIRGCVSMNTAAYQFFVENALRAVPRGNSYSLWFTGDNSPRNVGGNPYASSMRSQIATFKTVLPFYFLASVRHVICPPGVLDPIGDEYSRFMRKVYSAEVDIWEIASLPPVSIAHKSKVISMLSDIQLWGTSVTDVEVLGGNLVILEEEPPRQMLESEMNPADRADLIMGDNPNRMEVIFHSEKPGYLVLSRAYTNLLRAYLDGEELPVLKANGPFMAVPVPGSPEERVLELTYHSLATKLSFALSILGIITVAAGIIFGRKWNTKRKNSQMATEDRT